MKAIGLQAFGGPEVLEVLDLPQAQLPDDAVRIRTIGCSINYADLQTRRGAFHAAGGSFPIVPGLDAAGIITEIGPAVQNLAIGDRVIAFPASGSYQEELVVPQALVFRVPDGVSDEQAVACPIVSFTAALLLSKIAELASGETVLIHAASGGVGTAAIQIARAMGAARIIGTVSAKSKAPAALAAGADEVISLAEDADFSALADGTVDVVLDSLGGAYTEAGLRVLRPYGRLVAFGNASGAYHTLSTQALHATCRSVRGFSIASTRRQRPAYLAEIAPFVFSLMRMGQLVIPVHERFPLEEAASAHALLETRSITGKLILLPESAAPLSPSPA